MTHRMVREAAPDRPELSALIEKAKQEAASEHDRRVSELLAANGREVERRRDAEREVGRLQAQLHRQQPLPIDAHEIEVRLRSVPGGGKTFITNLLRQAGYRIVHEEFLPAGASGWAEPVERLVVIRPDVRQTTGIGD